MLTKAQIKRIRSLQQKKYRALHQQFLVEGEKPVKEVLGSRLKVDEIFATEGQMPGTGLPNFTPVTEKEIKKISGQQTPQGVMAVVRIPGPVKDIPLAPGKVYVALDRIRDPGNLGTIIRAADWFGVSDVFCSSDSVDVYNPKVVQSTMGSIGRVHVHYVGLSGLLAGAKTENIPVFAAVMDGDDYRKTDFGNGGILLVGNEANGLSGELLRPGVRKVSIPKTGGAESLNAAVATSIFLSVMAQ